ncbi:beta strand repeat-containing protein [Nostoc sp.]|uniref:beta strand repeat-containing protein n=1 Tax=Nostoc sp. TaxID=1180 RepID=UPI002FF45F71
MVNQNKSVNKQRKLYQSLVATALLTGSFFQFLAPVFADGTTAGTSISNTATATYEDPNSPGTTINATSNTVVVTVAEVAGITVTASGVTDATSSPTNTTVQVGDLLIYTYNLTNVGNDPTKFHIPNQATTTGPGTVSGTLPNGGTANSLQYSTDGGQTWTNVPQGGVDTPSVPVGGTVLVRVPVTVQAGAQTNDIITVTLGNTPGDAQNQLRSPDGGDVFTVDNPDGSVVGEVVGTPVNGTREASATEQIKVGLTVKTYALATILKIRSGYNNAGTTAITDDKLTYDLSLRVESNDPTGQGITPAALTGTSINVDGVASKYILVSDAIPAGTDLAVAPTAPPGWRTVYTTNPITTNANTANWTTTAPGSLASVTRIGFINNPATITSIAPGTTVNGFSIQLAVESTASSPLTVANIAQLFGQTPTNNFPVYDESGDQNPSNYDGSPGSMTPPVGTDTNGDGVPDTLPPGNVDDGYINTPASPETGTDTGNNNSGTGTGGEANVFTVQAPIASALLNGPQNAPDATGPSGGTNDDFTNKSSLVPAGTPPGSTLDPQSVGFTNTVKNSGTDSGVLKIEPTPPAIPGDLPNGTKVTITYNSQSAVYTYNNGAFALTAGTAITIPNVAPGVSINYGVEVDLPPGTQLSTDISKGFPVPITASIDNYTIDTNADGIKDSGNDNIFDSSNITIDRVYTGFLKLLKTSRVLQGTGPVVQGNDGTFSIDPKKPAPGNIIEYQIQYTNISDPQSGTGNVILNANKVVITEDGTKSPNNWALDNDASGQIDTSNIVGSAKDSGTATIQFYSGNPANTSGIDQTGTTANTDVAKYIDTVTGAIAPGIQRTFTFQRKVN